MIILLAVLPPLAPGEEEEVLADFRVVTIGRLAYEVGSSEPFTGITVSYWPDGKKRLETVYRAGQRVKQTHYKDGHKEHETEYRDGREHGTATVWDKSGQVVAMTEYRDGERHGRQTKWYKNGQKYEEGEYRNDRKTGKWIRWSRKGAKIAEIVYRDGEVISRKDWDEFGNLIKEQ